MRRIALIGVLALAALAAVLVRGSAPDAAPASSHREAPRILPGPVCLEPRSLSVLASYDRGRSWSPPISTPISRNAVDVLPAGELEEQARPRVRVKLGIDVTAPHVHVGHAIPAPAHGRVPAQAGHVGVLIIGDYTTRIGDPSGRSSERPILSDEEIDANARTYLEQAAQIVDTSPERLAVRMNGEWLRELDFAEVVRLTRTVPWLACSSGTTSPAASRPGPPSRYRAPLSLHAGVRFGRDPSRHRARRHGSALQPPRRP